MANQESRLAIVIDSKQAEQNIKRLRTALKNVGKESIDAGVGLEVLNGSMKPLQKYDELFSSAAKASKEMTKSVRLLSKETVTASKGFSQIASKAKASAAATKNLGGVMSSTAQKVNKIGTETQKATREMQRADIAANKLGLAMGKLKSIVAGAFVGFGVSSILKAADTMQSLNSQVRLVTNSISEFNAVQSQLGSIANKQYTDIESLTQLYTRSRRALEQLGKTQQQTLDFTNNIAMAMRVGGASAQEQSAALLQLSQALASGVLRGDEFNSIAEQAPILLSLVAKEMGVAQGALRELAADGKITSEIVYNAVANATGSLEDMASKMPTTVGQALTVLQNNYKEFVGNLLNDTTGVSGALAKVITVVANNFSNLITVVAGGAVVWGAYAAANSAFVTTTIPALIAGVQTSIASIMAQSTAIQASIASTLSLATMQEFLTATTYRLQQARVVATLTLLNYKLVLLESIAVVRAKTASVLGAIAVQAQYALSVATSGNLLSILTMSIAGAATSLIAKTTATLAAIRSNVSYATSLVATHGVLGATAIGVTNLTRAIIAKTIAMGNAVRQTSIYSLALKGLGGATKVAGGAFLGLGGAVAKVASVLRAHPILAIAGVLFTVISATDGLSKAMESLSDAIKVVAILFADFVNAAVGWIKFLANAFSSWISGFIKGSQKGVNESAGLFSWMFDTTAGGFVGLLQVVANVFDMAAKVVGAFVLTVGKAVYNLAISIGNNAKSMANVLISGFNFAGRAIANILNGIISKANSAINLLNKIPGVDIGTIDAKVQFKEVGKFAASEKLDNSFKGNFNTVSGIVDKHGARAHLDSAIGRLEAGKKAQSDATKVNLDLANAVNGVGNALDDAGKKGKKAGDKTKKAAKKAKEELSEEEKAAQKLAEAFAQATAQLRKSIAMVGVTTEFEKWKYDLKDTSNELSKLDNAAKSVLLGQSALLDRTELIKTVKDNVKEINKQTQLLQVEGELNRELLSIQIKANEALEKYNALKEAGMIEDYNAIAAAVRINAEKEKGLAILKEEQRIRDDLSNSLGTLRGELLDYGIGDNPYLENDYKLEDTLETLRQSMKLGLTTQEEFDKLSEKAKQKHYDTMRELNEQYVSDTLGSMSSMFKGMFGEQSKAYRIMFAIEKGFAIAKSIMAIQTAMASATASLPFPANLPVIAQVAAQGAQIIGNIRSVVAPVGQAHDGIMSVPKSGTWNLEKGERVLPQHTAKALDKKLDSANDTPSVNITVNVDAKGNTQIDEQNANNMSRRMAQGMKAVALEVIRQEKRQGGILSA